MSVSEIFVELQGFLAAEQDIREASLPTFFPFPCQAGLLGPALLGLLFSGRMGSDNIHITDSSFLKCLKWILGQVAVFLFWPPEESKAFRDKKKSEEQCGFTPEEAFLVKEIRKVVQSLEQTAREILTLLQGVHQGTGFQDIPKRCLKAREHFGTVKTHLTSLKTKFPAEQYYRFHEHWRFVLQRLVFLAAFVVYLETETLVTREAVTEILGIEPDREKGFHLDVEDYLSGVLILASELSRLSVNSVTAGDYSRPLHISTFINELDSGFRLLNLKNDSLRKRYDGLKYDVKKVEEVVYDLSIRGFNKETAAACGEK
ncbi:hypothetical protein U0070_006992 [Myodes glareolus]|uniref:Translin n=1 Tax=Myodes glareolus TaxID=447135 RepID=A0AAW0IBQ4_MYOGA